MLTSANKADWLLPDMKLSLNSQHKPTLYEQGLHSSLHSTDLSDVQPLIVMVQIPSLQGWHTRLVSLVGCCNTLPLVSPCVSVMMIMELDTNSPL